MIQIVQIVVAHELVLVEQLVAAQILVIVAIIEDFVAWSAGIFEAVVEKLLEVESWVETFEAVAEVAERVFEAAERVSEAVERLCWSEVAFEATEKTVEIYWWKAWAQVWQLAGNFLWELVLLFLIQQLQD